MKSSETDTRTLHLPIIAFTTTVMYVFFQYQSTNEFMNTFLHNSGFSSTLPFDPYAMALEESLGFFDNIPQDEWDIMRNITLRRVNNADPKNPLRPNDIAAEWYQKNWDPDFSCRLEAKVGVGDGSKWVCDPHRLKKQAKRRMDQYARDAALPNQTSCQEIEFGCLVYSIGSNGDFRFEEGFHSILPNVCEIHTFDFTDYSSKVPKNKNIFFHHWGLKASYVESKVGRPDILPNQPFKTLQETIQELGHEGRPIDIFKIDCERCEWSTYKDWLKADLRQILVEVHNIPAIVQDFFSDLQKAGYVTFHKEPNIQYGGGRCVEYAMLKLSTKFVEDVLVARERG